MKHLLIYAAIGCTVAAIIAIIFGLNSNDSGVRIIDLNPAYTQRVHDGYWKRGSDTPEATITLYNDFQCAGCIVMYQMVESAMTKLGDKVQLRFYNYPMAQDKNADLAAKGAEAAGAQGKFWNMYQLIYANYASWIHVSQDELRTDLITYAQNISLNPDQFKQDLNSTSIQNQIDTDMTAGNAIPIPGAPSLAINGKIQASLPKNADELVTLVNQAISIK